MTLVGFPALHDVGQRGDRRVAGEGEQHGESHLSEKTQRRYASQPPLQWRIHPYRMDEKSTIVQADKHSIRAQHRRPVVHHYRRQHAEHAYRSQRHNIIQHLRYHLVEAECQLVRQRSTLPDMHHRHT